MAVLVQITASQTVRQAPLQTESRAIGNWQRCRPALCVWALQLGCEAA